MAATTHVVVEKKGSAFVVHDQQTGCSYPLKGYGALKGQIAFRGDIDLTKPIAEQVAKIDSRRKKTPRKTAKAAA